MVEPAQPGARSLARSLARLNALWLGVTVSSLAALGVWLATIVLVLKGGPDTGAHLGLLSHYLPSYAVTLPGAFIGAAWTFVLALVLSVPAGFVYYVGVLKQAEPLRGKPAEELLGTGFALIRIPEFAMAFGLLSGATLFLATILLVIQSEPGQPLGPTLGLLQQYLPAYTVSVPGSLIGAAYMVVIGGAAFACVGWIYNRFVAPQAFSRNRGGTA